MKEGLGYSVATASWVILIMTFAQLVGILMGATLGDMFDKRKVAALCMLAHALGMVCLTFANDMTMLMAFGLFHGVAWGLRGPFMQAIRADYFGRNAIGLILGLSAAIIALGQIAGPMVAGVLADLTGDYQLGFSLLALLSALGSLCFILATKPVKPVANQ
jgi:MFS family permease